MTTDHCEIHNYDCGAGCYCKGRDTLPQPALPAPQAPKCFSVWAKIPGYCFPRYMAGFNDPEIAHAYADGTAKKWPHWRVYVEGHASYAARDDLAAMYGQ